MERCQEPTQRAQQAVQQELQHVQDSLSRLLHFWIITGTGCPSQNVERQIKPPWHLGVCCNVKTRLKTRWAWKTLQNTFFFGPSTQFLKVGPNTPESEMRKFRGEFETCAIACCDKWLLKLQMLMFDCRSHFPATFLQLSLPRSIAKMPNLLIKLKEAFESGKL